MQTFQFSKTEDAYINLLDNDISLARDVDHLAAIRLAMAAREKALLKFYRRRALAGLPAGEVAE